MLININGNNENKQQLCVFIIDKMENLDFLY